jgi:REP element-mobilizing transposase RayT
MARNLRVQYASAVCYVMMTSSHFHLVTETPRGDLADEMRWLLGVHTNRFNDRHQEFGHLFSSRCKALYVEGSGDGYPEAVCDYTHLNPVRAGLIAGGQPLQAYRRSSYPSNRPSAHGRPYACRRASAAPQPETRK